MIKLHWPPVELSPNARVHHHVSAKAKKAYRESCYWAARSCRMPMPDDGEILLSLEFRPPDNRRRDLDNMLASIKAGLDGFADAHEVNDHRFALLLRRGEPVRGGAVLVTVAP